MDKFFSQKYCDRCGGDFFNIILLFFRVSYPFEILFPSDNSLPFGVRCCLIFGELLLFLFTFHADAYIMARVSEVITDPIEFKELWEKVKQGTYTDALAAIRKKVNLIDDDGVY